MSEKWRGKCRGGGPGGGFATRGAEAGTLRVGLSLGSPLISRGSVMENRNRLLVSVPWCCSPPLQAHRFHLVSKASYSKASRPQQLEFRVFLTPMKPSPGVPSQWAAATWPFGDADSKEDHSPAFPSAGSQGGGCMGMETV